MAIFPFHFFPARLVPNLWRAKTFANGNKSQTAGKEEERAMFQQMQAMAQKQVNINFHLFCI